MIFLHALHTALHDTPPQKRGAEDPPLLHFRAELNPKFAGLFSVNGQDTVGVISLGKGLGQETGAEHRTADALKGAGTDEARRLAYQKDASLTGAEIHFSAGTGDLAGFGLDGISEAGS